MSTEGSPERLSGGDRGLSAADIQVRRAPGTEAPVLAAARAWALAFEAVRRQEATNNGSAELALYDALLEVDALKAAELALYEAVITAELTAR